MLTRTRARRERLSRRGFTLVELLIVIVLLSIVVGGIMNVILKQQQFYTGSATVMDARASVRQGVNALQADLRVLSPKDSDIYSMGASFIQFRQAVGASTVCSINSAQSFTVPGMSLAQKNGLTAWLATPVTGDSVLIYDTQNTPALKDDAWRPLELSANAAPGATCPVTTGLTTSTDTVTGGWTFSLSQAMSGTITTGSAIRIFRPARYQLYQAADNNWYLGFSDYVRTRTPAWSTLQPVSGPYAAGGTTAAGVQFAYFDSTGAATNNIYLVRRIDLVLRALTPNAVNMPGLPRAQYRDSLSTTIAVRN